MSVELSKQVILIQNWWKNISKKWARCRRGQCKKLIPGWKQSGFLCGDCYEDKYRPSDSDDEY